MENQRKKCSTNKHLNIDAIIYCPECQKYICNKCQNFHSEFFVDHNPLNLDKNIEDSFINICKQENHNYKLEFYCKTHNILCCAGCCTKIKNDIYGQHKDCDIYFIKDIKNDKQNSLKENIKILEDLSKNFELAINDIKTLFEKIEKNKEELKIKIQKSFTEIRNCLNEKEEQLLSEIDEKFNENYFQEDLIKEGEKLPKKIKLSLEKGKKVDNEWNDNNLSLMINNCIEIENNIKNINLINNNINKLNSINKKEIRVELDEIKINNLLQNIKQITIKDNFYLDIKDPIQIIKVHTAWVYCLLMMQDGRIASGSGDHSIIIYNSKTFQPDLIIKEHKDYVLCIIQLYSGILASCSRDGTINLFRINNVKYEKIQTLNYHTNKVYKIIELKNNLLASCSEDRNIIFYKQDKEKYIKDFHISTDKPSFYLIQTKEDEICYSDNEDSIFFYDLIEKKIKTSLSNLNKTKNCNRTWFLMMSKDLLVIPGNKQLTIVDVNKIIIKNIIETPGINYGVCLFNKKLLFTGDNSGAIFQWKIEDNNLIFVSKKEKAHNYCSINVLINMGNNYIVSGSDDYSIKIWG